MRRRSSHENRSKCPFSGRIKKAAGPSCAARKGRRRRGQGQACHQNTVARSSQAPSAKKGFARLLAEGPLPTVDLKAVDRVQLPISKGKIMRTTDMLAEIRDANLSYLMLAQQMIRSDKPAAIFRLGISESIANLLDSLSTSQVLKLSGGASMLTRFRFDDAAILGMLTHDRKDSSQSQSHAAILLAAQAVNEIH